MLGRCRGGSGDEAVLLSESILQKNIIAFRDFFFLRKSNVAEARQLLRLRWKAIRGSLMEVGVSQSVQHPTETVVRPWHS